MNSIGIYLMNGLIVAPTVKLEWKAYKLVYNEILHAMAVVENDPTDGSHFCKCLTIWAGFGMCIPILLHYFTNSHGF